MRFLSDDLHLLIKYTSHSIWATVITALDEEGLKGRHIMKQSSQKNDSSIKEYTVKCTEKKHWEMSETLSNALLPKHPKPSQTITVITETQNSQDIQNMLNLPAFDPEEHDNFNTIDNTILALADPGGVRGPRSPLTPRFGRDSYTIWRPSIQFKG